jgi:uncharacterized hydrophobic protein (TIGR00271 family)
MSESSEPSRPQPHTILLIDATTEAPLKERLAALFPDCVSLEFASSAKLEIPAGARVVCWLDDRAVAELLPLAMQKEWSLGLLPHPALRHGRIGFGIAATPEAAAQDILEADEAAAVDLLLCNGEPVLNSVVVARGFAVSPDSSVDSSWWARWQRARRLLRHIRSLRLIPMTLVTHKEKRFHTAAFGVLGLQHAHSSRLSRRLLDDTSLNDGMLHALVLAPRSVGELLRFVLGALLPERDARLPPFVAQIRTAAQTITSHKPLEYVRDGVAVSATEIELRVEPAALRLYRGRHVEVSAGGGDTKEVVRAQALPRGEARTELITHPLPLVVHAGNEEFRELYPVLRESARASPTFLVLMALASLLAALGLFADSPPVTIGAMVLAPLMAPIISLGLGVVRQDERLIRTSARTMAIGAAIAMAAAAAMTLITPLHTITAEIGARLRPTLLDLGVAIISGVAGAYCHARAEAAKNLAGVALAVALVPPLVVAGIGIGWGEWPIFRAGFLLFLTNLGGIVFAVALTFLVMGYSAFHMARRGLVASLLVVAVISVPLALGFQQMVVESRIVQAVQGFEHGGIAVREASLLEDDPLLLSVTLVSSQPIEGAHVLALKEALGRHLGQPVALQVSHALLY